MSREMLVNVAVQEECRVAVVEDGRLEELYMERSSFESHVGNVYKAKVANIEPSIQAAFLDCGFKKNGFLHISDLHPRYYLDSSAKELVGKRKSLKDRPPIQQCLKRGQEILVQVTKEGLRAKGPTLTTYISLPGKYLIFMPWMDRVGVSQKIDDDDERKRLKEFIHDCKKPENAGFIIRTAGAKAAKKDLQADLTYLTRLWESIYKRSKSSNSQVELYTESDLAIRAVRDVFNSKIRKIICDSEDVAIKIRNFISLTQPRFQRRVSFYAGGTPLFHQYEIEDEIKKVQCSRVELKSGGSVVIEQTEALVAIDVNSGRYRKHSDAERTAYKINIEAAEEIARQLRLRDLGGLIICDFIDMRETANKREVEKVFRAAIKPDRARSRVLRMSAFGLIEMTRQRMRPSLESSIYFQCEHCSGRGFIKSSESMGIEMMRLFKKDLVNENVAKIELSVSTKVAEFLLNNKRKEINKLEETTGKTIIVKTDNALYGENYQVVCFDDREKTL